MATLLGWERKAKKNKGGWGGKKRITLQKKTSRKKNKAYMNHSINYPFILALLKLLKKYTFMDSNNWGR